MIYIYMIRYFLVFLFLLLILADCIGDMCFHQSIHNKSTNSKVLFYIGMIMSLIIGLIWYYILKHYNDIAIPNALYQCLSILAITFVSIFVLKETLTNQKMIGIGLCVLGILCIQL